ncbi:MAG: hypothetical protein AB7Q16_07875 [Vicinamibacterales bacterium]
MAEATIPRLAVRPGSYDRAFYSTVAFAMAAVVVAGFGPTFYFRPLFGAPVTVSGTTTLSTLTIVHGLVFTAWVVLFPLQTTLIASRRVALHRRLGIAGAVLAVVMVVIGLRTAIVGAARGAAPPGVDPLAFLAVPVFDMVCFTGFMTVAIWLRTRKEAHKRLMLLAYASILTAATARVGAAQGVGPLLGLGLSLTFIAAGVVYDRVSRGRVHPAYVWGGTLLGLSIPARLALSGTAAWRALAEALVR